MVASCRLLGHIDVVQHAYIVKATVEDGRCLRLDEPLPLSGERVRVTVEPLQTHKVGRSYAQVVEAIHARLTAIGHVSPTREQVDACLHAERDSWGN